MTRPVISETMELVSFMSPHFIKMSALTGRNSAVMISSSASHFIAKLIMMQTSRFVSVHITVSKGPRFALRVILFAISHLR